MKNLFLLTLLSGSAYAAEHNHLNCKNIKSEEGLKTDCLTQPEVIFQDGASNLAQPYHTEYSIQTNFNCPGNMLTSIMIRAGAANPGFRLKLGSNEVIKLYGVGPVTLEDTNNKSTSLMRLSLNCSLSFKLLGMKPSMGTVETWVQLQAVQKNELSDLLTIFQTRSTIAFWAKKAAEGDASVIQVLTKLRDDTQNAFNANPTNFVLEARLMKYNEILDKMPIDVIMGNYREIFDEIQNSVNRSNKLLGQLIEQKLVADPDLVKLVDSAQATLNKGF